MLHNKTPEQRRKSISGLHAKTLRERERERERGVTHILQGILQIRIKHRCYLLSMITKPMTRKELRECG